MANAIDYTKLSYEGRTVLNYMALRTREDDWVQFHYLSLSLSAKANLYLSLNVT